MLGNAVSVSVAHWIGRRLSESPTTSRTDYTLLPRGVNWPKAAWGHKGAVYAADVSTWPTKVTAPPLAEFLRFPLAKLSERATRGFLTRARVSGLRFERGFLEAVERHLARVTASAA